MKFTLALASFLATASAFTSLVPPSPHAVASVAQSTTNGVACLSTASALAMAKQVPHGADETLVDLMCKTDEEKNAAIAKATVELEASDRQLCDVELIMNGGFSPLTGFMNEEEYQSVVENMALPDGTVFGLPVVFDTDDENLQPGTTILLKQGDRAIATVELTDKFTPDKPLECLKCYGTSQIEHPGTLMVATERGRYYMGGKVTGLNLPVREFPCKTPQEVRAGLPDDKDVVAFQCRNPVHRAHYELFTRALDDALVSEGGIVLVHPTCGPTQADDISGEVRYKTYEVLKEETANPRVQWEYLPYSMHMAGPREAIQHMIIRKNFGCTHFIIGRDMAGSKSSVTGDDFYGAYDAQECAEKYSAQLGVTPVPSEKGLHTKKLSGTKFRQMLRGGDDIPEWFAFKSVVKVLRDNM
jgi:sulfate adenylyltransferase